MKETVLLKQRTEKKASPTKKKRYQGITRSLMFSMIKIRPDVAFATSVPSCFAKNPRY